jgi:hypothetical protein
MIFRSQKHTISSFLCKKSIDFALENEIITESSFHLLTSEAPEHQTKDFSLHLN